MKFSFSTLACPEWTWPQIFSAARDLGFDGIELRGIAAHVDLPRMTIFAPEHIEETKGELDRLSLEIPLLATGAFLGSREKQKSAVKEVKEYMALAEKLGTPYLRILGDIAPEPGQVDQDILSENLEELLPIAAERGRMLLIETNGIFADSNVLASLIEKMNHKALGVLWDIHHPYRYFYEPVAETFRRLSPHIRHVHMKDSVMEGDKVVYKMFGRGDIPLKEAMTLLYEASFDGYLSLEWVKRWCADLEAPGISLPHYITVARSMLNKIQQGK